MTATALPNDTLPATAEKQPKPPILAGQRGLQLQSLADMYRFAEYVAASGLAPKGIDTPQAVMVALQMGAEVGLTPMAALQNIAVINGRPSIWGDGQLAIVRGSGVFDESVFEETFSGNFPSDDFTATCTVRRTGAGSPVVRTFSIGDAKKAGLWGKTGPWSQYPKRMLQCRARSFALRDAFTDVLRGFMSSDEAQDMPVKYVENTAPAPTKAASMTERLKAQTETTPASEPPAAADDTNDSELLIK